MGVWRIRVEEETGKALGDPRAVGASAGTDLRQLAISADGSSLAYSSVTAASHIQRVSMAPPIDAEAGDALDLWRGSRTAVDPSISPSGEWVAFCFFSGGGKTRLAVIRPDGTDLRYLTAGQYADYPTGWSPDGSRVTFYSNRSGTFEVWTVEPNGDGLRQLTETPEADTFSGPWSPDGSLMAIWTAGGSYLFDPRKPWAEQSPMALPPQAMENYFIPTSWSADGKQLAGIWGTSGLDAESKIAYFSLEEHGYEISAVEGGSPIWLEDGRRLLFLKDGKIFLLDSESGEYGEVVSVSPGHVDSLGSISPDNRWIYFSRRLAEADLWLLNPE